MKKVVIVAAVVLLLGVLVSSCKSSHTCPAYGKVKTEKTESHS